MGSPESGGGVRSFSTAIISCANALRNASSSARLCARCGAFASSSFFDEAAFSCIVSHVEFDIALHKGQLDLLLLL